MQTIGPTFNAHALPGCTNIYDPVCNAAAAIRYIQARYGDISNVPGVRSMRQGGLYLPYERGGWINKPVVGLGLRSGASYSFAERGPEYVVPTGAGADGGSGRPNITIHIGVADERTLRTLIDGRFSALMGQSSDRATTLARGLGGC